MILGALIAPRMGFLLPESILHSEWFAVLAAFVAVNTLLYLALAIAKLMPKPRPRRGRVVRSETRSIHPDGPV
ncbi:hypothetical protein [Microbacterium sp. JZ31]|uniref:hypothetical protein n=1 Tax=Microbacterium sp. JZ31 TaxID=1906274 RepID=UPI001EE3A414|nr:hypothetical protein [Microbacterium sp. JZ31]